MREQKELYQEHKDVAQERNDLPSKEQVDKLAKMASDKDDRRKIRNSYKKDSQDVNQRYEENVDKAKEFYRENEDALNDTARVEMEQELGIDKEEKESKRETISKTNLKSKATNLLMGAGVFLAGAGVLAWGYGNMKGTVNESAKANSNVDPEPDANEEITVNETPEEIGEEIEINSPERENSDIRAEIETDRTYSFSQLVARINHYPDTVERNELLYWDINESAGQITVTRPYGESHEDNPHNEVVEFEFYPNDEQAIFEWNELDIRANLPAGAFWIKTDSTGGAVKIEFLDEKGELVKKHEGEMVMAEWTDKDGKTRNAIQFRDEITGETRPAAFQTHEIKFDDQTGKAVDIEYPYHTAKVTFEPTPGSYMQLVTGPTIHFNPDNPYGPDHDQGFGFYLWDKDEEIK